MWIVTSEPAAEPIAVSYAKNYLKVSTSADDTLIEDLLKAARQYVEKMTSRAMITQTITEYWDEFPTDGQHRSGRIIDLGVGPVQSLTSLQYVPEDGTPAAYTTWDNTGNSKYFLDSVTGYNKIGPARIIVNPDVSWPEIENYKNAVKATYVVGYGASGSSVPGPLKVAMLRLVGVWYQGRDWKSIDEWSIVGSILTPYLLKK